MQHLSISYNQQFLPSKLCNAMTIKALYSIAKYCHPTLCPSYYLTGWHQVKRVQQEETEALDEEHVVAVLPNQEEGESSGTHGKIA